MKARVVGSVPSKVYLRRPLAADGDTLFKWINDRALVVQSAPFRPVARGQHDDWFAQVLKGGEDRHFFIVARVHDDEVVGSCQLLSVSQLHHSAELQIRIGNVRAQGKGYGTEAVAQLVRFGFETLKLHRIGLHVFATNLRAIKTYEKVGFCREGVMLEAAFVDGRYVDIVCMGILNRPDSGHASEPAEPVG